VRLFLSLSKRVGPVSAALRHHGWRCRSGARLAGGAGELGGVVRYEGDDGVPGRLLACHASSR
jgi:hypothetical protein